MVELTVNGQTRSVDADLDTPLLYVLRDHLELNAAKYGCGLHNGVGKSNGHGHVDPRLAARDVADEKLLAAIAKTPGLSRAEMCNRISRSPNTVKSTLQRLRDAGHIERDDDGAWKLVDQTEPAKPVPKWVKPLSVRSAPADA
jgi:hypothetical protein